MGRRIRDDDRSWRRHEIAKRIEDIRTHAKDNVENAHRLLAKIESAMPLLAKAVDVKEVPPRTRARNVRKALGGS